jgi:hypothetical protein
VDYLRIINITNIRNVTNIENIINVSNINRIHYRYRTIATTAVPPDVFRNGLPVAHRAMSIPREQLAKAPIIPHPALNPTERAVMPGKPVSHLPVRTLPRVASTPAPRGAPTPPPSEHRTSPTAAPEAPPHAVEKTPELPMRRLITRLEPPPPPVDFSEVRPALDAHPGRALEPEQLENLRVGRPAGPMMGKEFPPHIAAPAHRPHR